MSEEAISRAAAAFVMAAASGWRSVDRHLVNAKVDLALAKIPSLPDSVREVVKGELERQIKIWRTAPPPTRGDR